MRSYSRGASQFAGLVGLVLLCSGSVSAGFLRRGGRESWWIGGRGGGGWGAAKTLGFEPQPPATDGGPSAPGNSTTSTSNGDVEGEGPPPGVVCKDGVCEMPSLGQPATAVAGVPLSTGGETTNDTGEGSSPIQSGEQEEQGDQIDGGDGDGEVAPELVELIKMGWDEASATRALERHGYDVAKAAEALAEEEENDLERWSEQIKELEQKGGWDQDSCLVALRGADGEVEAAKEALEAEDLAVSLQFEESVEDMVGAGWAEDVARQALLLQWQNDIERQSSRGIGGVERSRMQLERAAKTLPGGMKRLNGGSASAGQRSAGGGAPSSSNADKGPPRAPKESVVFDVTEDSFQSLVLESPVPVLVDVYADWCGPCKQLTPALEEAAMRAGGAFRLAKINSDSERGLSEVLKVRALPSIFAFRDGQIVDNFVGIPDQGLMQQFMLGLVMPPKVEKDGEPEQLREGQLSRNERRSISFRLQHMAGMAELGLKRKESLQKKVNAALQTLNAEEESPSSPPPEDAVRLTCKLILNAMNNLSDDKFRRINQASKAYQVTLSAHPATIEILRLAGFREQEGDEGYLVLRHRNVAVLSLVRDLSEKWVLQAKRKKAAELKKSAAPSAADEAVSSSPSPLLSPGPAVPSSPKAHIGEKAGVEAPQVKLATLHITLPGETAAVLSLNDDTTLSQVFAELDSDVERLESRFPPRTFFRNEDGHVTLHDAGLSPSARLVAGRVGHGESVGVKSAAADASSVDDQATAKEEARQKRREEMKSRAKKAAAEAPKKSGNLWGEGGIAKSKKRKGVEHFGGDSTVTLAVEDDTDEEEDGSNQGAEDSPDEAGGDSSSGNEE